MAFGHGVQKTPSSESSLISDFLPWRKHPTPW